MDEQIEPIYKKFNYPNSVQKLLKLVKIAGINSTTKDVQTFLDKRVSVQQTKVTKKSRRNMGKIVAFKALCYKWIYMCWTNTARATKGMAMYLL